jgi:CubicO group peptidase (beta-lactamase class C family)
MGMNNEMDHAQLIAWTLRNRPLERAPGLAFAYSNFGYCLLGRVIEKLTSRPYAEFVGTTVLQRCGISEMAISGNTLAERHRGEVIYYGQNGEDPYRLNVTRMDSHGGWIASPADLVQFAMHVSGFAKPPNILKRETIDAMTAPSAVKANYAKGWRITRSNNWWHTGALPGTATIMMRDHTGFCWAACTNSRTRKSLMRHDLDRQVRLMLRQVKAWQV